MAKKTNLGFRVYRPHGHTARHHVRFKDHVGVWRRVVAYSDAVASAALGRQLRTLSDQRAAGLPMSQESVSFVQGADAGGVGGGLGRSAGNGQQRGLCVVGDGAGVAGD